MNCMKCGREISEGQVFCQDCLDVMSRHPIPPETPLQILRRPVKAPEKKTKEIPPAEQIKSLRGTIRGLVGVLFVLLMVVCVLVVLLMQSLRFLSGNQEKNAAPRYSTVPATSAPVESTAPENTLPENTQPAVMPQSADVGLASAPDANTPAPNASVTPQADS